MDTTPLVLIADDDAQYRDYLRLALGGRGPYRLIEAPDGDAAWEMLVSSRPAVALLDLDMPGLKGLELVQRIRADRELRGMYVVVLTASRGAGEAAASLAAGADRHLTKPHPTDALRRVIAQGLRLADSTPAPGHTPSSS